MPESTLATIDVVIIVSFLVLVTIVGLALSKVASKGLDDYFLGGKRLPWWVLGASTSTSNFDMAGTMIIVAVVFALGYRGFLVEIRGGVGLSLAFLMVFLAKWLRRSRVMTSAEWMKLRFGTDRQGRVAHLLSAIANIVLSLGMIIYFAKGAGLFLTHFLPLDEVTCTAIMVAVGLFYTLMAGLYGVVFTDLIQMVLLVFTALFVTVEAFQLTPSITFPAGFLDLNLSSPDGLGQSLLANDPGWSQIFNFFGICVILWVFRTTLEGFGGVGGYTDQRFFAARTEREASLLTFEAIILSIFRWTMVAGLVVMGLHVVQSGGAGADLINGNAEQVLPVVLGQFLPAGIKGLVIAGLIAAAMSTFDSTLNAGAAYIVRDIYQTYIHRTAERKQLMRVSRWATIGLCAGGILFAAIVPNINQIWGLITMGIGAGMFIPLVLRWYWPRFNGYGFAAGTAAGIVGALIFKALLAWPLHTSFPTIIACALVASVVTSLLTPATPEKTLIRFWKQINPWGPWRHIARLASERGETRTAEDHARIAENRKDRVALLFSVPFQLSVLVAAMSLVFHDWGKLAVSSAIAGVSLIGLYFTWYRNLKSAADCEEEDRIYGGAAGQS